MKLRIDKKDCLKKNIKVPKGYRLIEDWECLKESRTNNKLRDLLFNSWVWVNTEKGIMASVFDCNSGQFHVFGGYYPDYDVGHSRRVLVKIEEKLSENIQNKKED